MTAPVTPTTQQVADNIVAQISASIGQDVPFLPKSFIRVLAKALAGVQVYLYKYGGYVFLQQFVRYASDKPVTINGREVIPLREWGALVGAEDPKEATQAELNVQVTVTNQTGTLPSGSQLVNPSTGVVYLTVGAVVLDAPTVEVAARASGDQQGGDGSGTIGNVPDGTVLQFANPLPNVSRDAEVLSTIEQGANAESTESYRQRILDRFQKPPQGGAYADYELWAEETPGIINAYPYTGDPGQVDVYSEATPESSGSPDGIPTTAQLEAVLDNINFNQSGLASRRPANAWVNSLAITRTGFDVTVTGITGVSDLASVQGAVTDALTEFFLGREPFIPGLSVLPRKDSITSTRVSAIVEDIVTAAGGTFTSAVFRLEGTGAILTTYTLGEGEKSKAASVVFV